MKYSYRIKQYLDQNVWDGEDRSSALNDSALFNPDELQELVEGVVRHVYAAPLSDETDHMGLMDSVSASYLSEFEKEVVVTMIESNYVLEDTK